MVSRPRQLLRRYDAGVRPYWPSGFGGYTKVYEYQVNGETKRKFSVAYVVRPRTETTNACLCFNLMSKMPDGNPWSRAADKRDPSRGVLLDLQEDCDWKMDSTVMLPNIDPVTALDDNMQVQCLPVYGADQPKWTYRRVPKGHIISNLCWTSILVQKAKGFHLPLVCRGHDQDYSCACSL